MQGLQRYPDGTLVGRGQGMRSGVRPSHSGPHRGHEARRGCRSGRSARVRAVHAGSRKSRRPKLCHPRRVPGSRVVRLDPDLPPETVLYLGKRPDSALPPCHADQACFHAGHTLVTCGFRAHTEFIDLGFSLSPRCTCHPASHPRALCENPSPLFFLPLFDSLFHPESRPEFSSTGFFTPCERSLHELDDQRPPPRRHSGLA